jgi:hypothetical protein
MNNNTSKQTTTVPINIYSSEFLVATDELKINRLSICNSCENKVNEVCKECSCLLVVRTSYTDSFCPIGKW